MSTKYSPLRVTIAYTAVVLIGLIAFFSACMLLASEPTAVPENSFVKRVARIAYRGSERSIQFTPECARYDERFTYLLRPGECRFARPEFDISVQVNSFGLRDDEESLDRPEIIVLGDSHAMGLGVAAEHSFPAWIEQALGRKVLNAAISSFGTAREMMMLQSLDVRLDLNDLRYVVIQYCDNDFVENTAYAGGKGQLDILSEQEYREFVRLSQQQIDSFLAPGLYVFRRAKEKTWRWLTGRPARSELTEEEADAFFYAIDSNKELLRDKHLIILEINGYNDNDAAFIERVRERFKESDLDPHFVRTSDFLADEDYFTLDNHMRPSGQRKVAHAVLDVIRNIETRSAAAR